MARSTVGTRPDHVFVAPSLGRKLIGLVGVLGVLGTGWLGWSAWEAQTPGSIVMAAGVLTLTVVCWVFLTVTVPQRITITGSIVEITRDSRTQSYDMEDPGVDLLVRDGSVAFGHYRDNWSVVRARDVDWRLFMDIVMKYQFQADLNAEERDRRFSR